MHLKQNTLQLSAISCQFFNHNLDINFSDVKLLSSSWLWHFREEGIGNECFCSMTDSLYWNCNCNYPSLAHAPLLQGDFLDPVMHRDNLLCTHLSTNACERDTSYKGISRSLLWKLGRGAKWHQTGIRYFHNLLTVPCVTSKSGFASSKQQSISVTCKESAGLWFKCVPSPEKLGGFHADSARTRSTVVLFCTGIPLRPIAWRTQFFARTDVIRDFFSPSQLHYISLGLFSV